jgi:ElaB/YqjD/DUF883 family membrane-anchored ribosome-binding protein
MQTQRIVDEASRPQSSDSTFATSTVASQRSARRATARRTSSRRATARQRKDDVEGRIDAYVQDHPHSTIGDSAKRLNVNRGTIAAERANTVRAGDLSTGGGQ